MATIYASYMIFLFFSINIILKAPKLIFFNTYFKFNFLKKTTHKYVLSYCYKIKKNKCLVISYAQIKIIKYLK